LKEIDMSTLKGKTLFITGASRGIGLAIARRAARDGANIVIAAKSAVANPKLPGTIHSAAAEIEAAGGQALPLQVDIREEESVTAAVAAAADRFGGIDILVNNASAIWLRGTAATPMKRYDLMHQVNARGTFLCSQACLHLRRRNQHPESVPPLSIQNGLRRMWPTPWPNGMTSARWAWPRNSATTACGQCLVAALIADALNMIPGLIPMAHANRNRRRRGIRDPDDTESRLTGKFPDRRRRVEGRRGDFDRYSISPGIRCCRICFSIEHGAFRTLP
jgi:hypothetical protein